MSDPDRVLGRFAIIRRNCDFSDRGDVKESEDMETEDRCILRCTGPSEPFLFGVSTSSCTPRSTGNVTRRVKR
jgi:hypothetical protein